MCTECSREPFREEVDAPEWRTRVWPLSAGDNVGARTTFPAARRRMVLVTLRNPEADHLVLDTRRSRRCRWESRRRSREIKNVVARSAIFPPAKWLSRMRTGIPSRLFTVHVADAVSSRRSGPEFDGNVFSSARLSRQPGPAVGIPG